MHINLNIYMFCNHPKKSLDSKKLLTMVIFQHTTLRQINELRHKLLGSCFKWTRLSCNLQVAINVNDKEQGTVFVHSFIQYIQIILGKQSETCRTKLHFTEGSISSGQLHYDRFLPSNWNTWLSNTLRLYPGGTAIARNARCD